MQALVVAGEYQRVGAVVVLEHGVRYPDPSVGWGQDSVSDLYVLDWGFRDGCHVALLAAHHPHVLLGGSCAYAASLGSTDTGRNLNTI